MQMLASKKNGFLHMNFIAPEKQLSQIKCQAVDLVSEEELLKKLKKSFQTKKPLRIKAGFDPSRPDLHLGHAVLLNKLKLFQDLHHQVVFLIGDFTAQIGDPSGMDQTRPILNKEEVKQNSNTYLKQVFKILDKNKTEVRFNSSWMDKISPADMIHLISQYTLARMLEREDFSKRFANKKSICLHEFLYPLLQGYDSVVLKADIELGGTDQLFNLLVGRELQKKYKQESQCILTMPVLEGLDGVKKMSKSYDNFIALEDSPREMFGKTMKISDKLMLRYYELLTDKTEKQISELKQNLQTKKIHPKKIKMELASFFVEKFHSPSLAKKAEKEFQNIFSEGGIPSDMEEFVCSSSKPIWICRLIHEAGLCSSTSEARRLIKSSAVSLDGKKIKDIDSQIQLKEKENPILKVGKRRFIKIKVVK